MRNIFHLVSSWLCAALVTTFVFLPKLSDIQSHPKDFVYVEGTYLMLNGERFIVKGYNYLPRDYGWTDMTTWDWEEVDREFALAKAYGANTIRTGLHAPSAIGDLTCAKARTFREVRPEYLEAVHTLVSIAEKHDLRLILWLGDLCPQFLLPAYYPGLERYIEAIVTAFADHPQIIAWDLQTDVDGFALQRYPIGCHGLLSYCTKTNMLNMLRFMADTIRQLDSHHLITVGFCWVTTSLLAQDFTDFLMPQVLGGDVPEILEGEAASQLQGYGPGAGLDYDTMVSTLEDKIRSLQSQVARPMPIVFAEYGSPSAGDNYSPELQRQIYDVYLEVAFLRLKLAGALNWTLTDFIWPPKSQPFAFLDNPLPVTEQNFGAFHLDYSPKPAAEIARAYYADAPTIAFQDGPEELKFIFSKTFVPGPEDTRVLAVAFDSITFLSADRSSLLTLDIGDPSARSYLVQGFSGDESPWGDEAKNFVWAGGEEKTARLWLPFPEGTRSISLRVNSVLEDMDMTVLVDDEEIKTLSLGVGWKTYTIQLPEEQPFTIGSTFKLRGKFNLPISEGTVTIQMSNDQIAWQDVASIVPERGRFAASIPIEHAGTLWLRAVWSGAGLYRSAVSEAISLEIPAPPVTPTATVVPPPATDANQTKAASYTVSPMLTVSPPPATASPTPVVESAPQAPIRLCGGAGALLPFLACLGICFVLRRRQA